MATWNEKQKRRDELQKAVTIENYSRIAKITAVLSGGYFNVELTSGTPITGVLSQDYSVKWAVGDWVTLEKFGGDWVIVGRAAYKGGD